MKKTASTAAHTIEVKAGAHRRRRALNGRGPAPLALEPRVMFDGATGDAVLAAKAAAERGAAALVAERGADASRSGVERLLQAAPALAVEAPAQRHEIVFIEDNVDNYQQIVAGVRPSVEVVVLDHDKDGLQQMLAALDGHAPVDAIHLVTHGDEAAINLGSANIRLENLDSFSAQFSKLGAALTADGDFLIYGCDVAAGPDGQQFVARVAAMTGADVAASVDTTGAAAFGGNWTLETRQGAIETAALDLGAYDGVLKVASINAISGDDKIGPGDTMTAIPVSGLVDNSSGQNVNLLVVGKDTSGNAKSVTITPFAAPKSTTTNWTTNLDLSGFGDGTITIYATQGSTAPTTSSFEASRAIIKDTTAPVLTASLTSTSTTSATFSLQATDANGISGYEYQLDSTAGSWTSYSSNTLTLAASAGSHTLYVRAIDNVSNKSTTSSIAFTISAPPSNTAPVASGDAQLANISEGTTNGAGATVSSLFTSHFSDADGDTLAGIAIVSYARNSSIGEWQYNSGAGWTTITGTASDSAAITFKSSDQLRFVPASGYTGAAPALTVRVIDSKATVTTNATVNTAGGGGTSDYSAATINLNTSVKPVYSLSSPDSKFVALLSGSKYDPVNDTQSHAADTDLVGDANTPLLLGGFDSNTNDLYYRVRIGNPTLSKGVPVFSGVVLLGLDVNGDGKLDVFIGVDGRNSGLGVVTFAPGSDLNVSPSTTSITSPQAIGANAKTAYTYQLTGGDVGADGKPDAYLTFTLPFSVLQARMAALGKPITTTTSMSYVLLTMTQNNSINGDIGGIGSLTKAQSATSWTDLGLLKPISLTAPSLGGISGNYQYVEDASAVAIAPNATFSDFDSVNFTGGKLEVTITANAESGKDVLALSGSNVSLSGNAVYVSGTQVGTYTFASNVLTVNFSGANVSADQVTSVVRAVTFQNTSQAPSTVNRTVQFKITDADGNANVPTSSAVTVLVQAVNDAPTVSGAATALNRSVTSGTTYAVGTATTANALVLVNGTNSNVSIADVDAGTGTVRATLGVSSGVLELYSNGSLVTNSTTIDGVTFTGSRTGSLVMTGTLSSINAILAGTNTSPIKVLYQSGLSALGTATLSLSVNDQGNTGTGGPLSATSTVGTITIANAAPTGPVTGSVTEDNSVTSGNLTASGTLTQTITATTFVGNTLGSSALGTLTFSSGTWTYTVSNSNASVQALANGQSIEESFKVDTAGGSVYVRVTINGVNDAPTLTVTNGTGGFTEGSTATTLFTGATATFGAGETMQAISSMTLDVTNVFDGDQIVIDGTKLYIDQSSSGTLTANGYSVDVSFSGGTATLSINTGQSTTAAIQSLVTGLAYQSASRNPTNYGANTTRTFTIRSLKDTGGTANGGSDTATLNLSRTLTVTPVNDPPALNVTPVTLNQGSTITLDSSYLLANDPDTNAAGLTYTVSNDTSKGTIKVNGVVATSFTQQDINDGKVTYTAAASGSNTSDTLNVSVSDGTTAVNNTVAVSIITTAFAPTTSDNSVTTLEDTSYVFSTADFPFSDFNTGDSLSKIELTVAPGAGKLQLNVSGTWQDLSWTSGNPIVLATDIAAGNLRFTPATHAYGTNYATFNYKVFDQTSLESASDAQMTVNVTFVNHAPVGQNATISATQGVAYNGQVPAATDIDGDTLTYSNSSSPAHGSLTFNSNGSYTYTPSASYSGSDSFGYTVSDGKGGTNSYTVSITVNTVNHAPVASNTSISTTQGVAASGHLPVATDADSDPITYAAGTSPTSGALTVAPDGSYTYTPNTNFNGSDSFTYTVSDNRGGSNTYTVSVTVSAPAPDSTAPVVTANQAFTYAENRPANTVIGTVAATDNVGVTGFRFADTQGSTNGSGYFAIDSSGKITMTVAGAASSQNDYESVKTVTVNVQARDAAGNWSASQAVTFNLTNIDEVAPAITSSATASAVEKQNLLYTAQATDLVDFTDKVVTYALGAGGDAASLSIDSSTGAVTLASGNLDFHAKSSYSFTVVASDATGNQSTKAVTVTVTSNDAVAPAFTSAATASAVENQNVLYTAAATDNVEYTDHVVSYSLQAGGDAAALSIDSSTGVVTLASGNLDYETKSSYSFTVVAKDATGNQSTKAVTVSVTNVDEVAPAFTSSATANAVEKQNLLYTAQATDLVDFTDKVVTYSLAAGGDAAALHIDPATGAVTLASGNLDFHTKSSYSFTVVASDATGNQSSKAVTVTVTSDDAVAPAITSAATASAVENQNVLYTAVATDNVEYTDHAVTYSLQAGGDAAALSIDSSTGVITLASGNLDYETKSSYSFTVVAKDATGNQSTKAVTVSVINVDEVAPAFTSPATANAVEKQNLLYTAQATDLVDFTDKVVTYSLATGGDSASLHIDPTTGAVTLASGNLDFHAKSSYSFTVVASDATGNQSTKAVTVTVISDDAVAPAITSAATASAVENQNVLYTAVATDNVEYTDHVVSYSLQAGGDAAALSIDSSTGVVTLASGNLDYETKSSYSFTVVAKDATGNQSTKAVTISVTNVDEVAPAFTSPATVNAVEKQNLLYTAQATDLVDFTDKVVTYSLGAGGDSASLHIDPTTGAVTLASGNLDFHAKSSYSFTVVASDATGNQSTKAVTVTVTSADAVAPAFTSAATASAVENQNVLYTAVATDNVEYTDHAVSYSLQAGGDAAALSIDASTGVVTLASGNLDYETKASYSFTVVAKDATGNQSTKAVTVSVTNVDEVAPAFTSSATANAVEKQNLLYTAQATDLVDFTDKVVTYSLAAGGDAAALHIDSATGAVTLASGNLDFHAKSSYSFTVVASDATGNQSTKAVTVTVTSDDAVAPAFTSSATASAVENQNVLYTAAAIDNIEYTDHAVSYSLQAGGDAAALSIDSSTGVVTLASGNLDYETKSSYSFTVVAKDATGNQSTKSVTVSVTNVDEVAPAFTSPATVNAVEKQNLLYTAQATDLVDFTDKAVTYSLATGGDAAALHIDSATGAVTLASGNLDFHAESSYSFTVVASDATGNQSTKAVTVTVTSDDAVAPAFTSAATASAVENQNVLYTAAATDNVEYTDHAVLYSLQAGGDAAALTIDSSTGVVTLASGNLDYETKSSYSFTVVAKDATGNQSTKAVTVSVTNVDEVAPAFTSSATANAVEKQNLLYTAQATDLVDFTDKVVTYSLAAGGDAAALHIDSATGAVTLATGNLDFHAKSSYSFTVVTSDATGNQSTKAVTVMVTSDDAVAPAFTSAATASAVENQNVLYTAAATDNVEYTDHAVSYSLQTGGDAAALSIDSSTGVVTLASGNLDYETKASYSFTVIAKDATGNQSTKAVTVSVTNVDEMAPAFTSSATVNAVEKQNLLYTAQATDLVDFTDKAVTYSLAVGGDAAALHIDSATGAVTLASGNLDFHAKSSYSFTVVASDATGNQSAKAVTVTVTSDDAVAPALTSSATASAVENQNVLYTAAATDNVEYTDHAVSYSLQAGGDAAALSIDSSTGVVTLASGNLDYETKASYSFTVIAKDATGNQSTKAVTVSVTNVDEVAPAFASSATANAIEKQNLLYTAQATDLVDFTDKVVTYALGAGGDSSALHIDSATGAVTLASGNLDFHAKSSYSFTVVASDATGNQSTKAVTVTVTSDDAVAPAFTSAATASAVENQNVLYTAAATDNVEYTDHAVSYSLQAGGDAAALSIDSSTGVVTLASGNLDYETKSSYNFTVVAKDATGNQSTKAVTVSVTNVDEVAPAFTSSSTANAVEKQNLLYTAQATDLVDFTDKAVIYSLAAGGDAAALHIDPATGAVTLASGNLDFHAKSSYSFTVLASDATGNQSTKAVTVTVTSDDAVAPAITSAATASAVENQNVLYTAVAIDNVEYTDHVVSYSLQAGGDAAALSIDASTGVVTLASGNLDYEAKPSYNFTVVAKDATGNQSTKAVTVSVTNVDEVAPAITSSATANAVEKQNLLYTAQATDLVDFTDKVVTYALGAGVDAAALHIDSATGAVTLASGNLDFHAKSSYSFTIVASDATGNQSTKSVTVTVTSDDAVAPAFTSAAIASAVENQNVLYTAAATDNVEYTDHAVLYSLHAGGDAAALSIDSSTGVVTLASGNLDYETKASYSFTVIAKDATGNQSTKAVTVSVTNVDEVAPAFTSPATVNAVEKQNLLYTAQATDLSDFTDKVVTYSLAASGDAAALHIDSATGAVTLASGNLDYETKSSYSFTVVAKDATGNQSIKAVTVSVTNVDEVAPAFTSSSSANAVEKQNLLYTAQATDLVDFTDKVVTYSLAAGGDAAALHVDPTTGAVTLASGNLDFHAKSSYSFTVVASDATGNQSTKAVTVTVTSDDAVAPAFTSSATASAVENQNVVYTAAATDDVEYTDHAVSYSLQAGGDAAALSIDSSTGVVTLASGNLDYETKSSYNFTVVAKDATGNQSTKAVTVSVTNVDEMAPAFTSSATVNAVEKQNLLYTAQATDLVDFTNKVVTYSLAAGGDAAALHIDSTTGAVTLTSGNLDVHAKSSYSFTVVASDATGNQSTKAVTVTVTSDDAVAPAFTSSATASAVENQNVLYTAAATDNVEYTDHAVSYSLQAGGDAAALTIDSSTGIVKLASGNLDYETKSSYSFTVVAKDATGNQSTKAVTVSVTNVDEVAPAFTSSATANAVEKQNLLYTAQATDQVDFTDKVVSYSLAAGGDAAALHIDPATGAVTLASGNLDVHAKSSYSFTVVASDATGNQSTKSVTVAVTSNDAVAPAFTSAATASAVENQNVLYTAAATDNVEYTDHAVSYSLQAGGDASALSIDASTGVVKLASGNLDYETKASYSFTVVAKDATGNQSTKAVTVSVTNIDEVAPAFTSSATVNAVEKQNLLYTAQATDLVDFTDKTVTYSLATGGDAASLHIDSASGAVTLASGNLDVHAKSSYTFTVVASDATGNQSSKTVAVTVTSNDAVAPAFTSSATASVPENQNVLYTAAATDSVEYTDHVVSYSLQAGGDAAALTIDSSTGVVTLASGNLDYETKTSYSFTVIAKDATGNQSTKAVTVSVTNVDEVAPAFTSATAASVPENQNVLYTAIATDNVEFTDHAVSYSLQAGGDAAALHIDSSTGVVTLASGNLDYETKAAYSFTVIAKDAAGNQRAQAVTVSVTNIDEVAPAFSSSAAVNAVENQNLLYTAQASDLVDFTDKAVTYSLAATGDASALQIDRNTGAVTLASGNLDVHAKSSYTFKVIASDATGNQSTKDVTVTVTSNDRVAPAFTSAATASVPENQNVLYTAAATDNVEFTDKVVSYSLAASGDAGSLHIDPATGVVTLASGNLDYEAKASYTFTVVAKDGTGNQSTKAITVSVTNVDELAPAFTSAATATANEHQNVLYTAQANDNVDFTDKVVTYSLQAGGDAAALNINASTGVVTLASGNLDFTAKSSYTFTVIASDATGNQSTRPVTVAVANGNQVPVGANGAITTDQDTDKSGSLPAATDGNGDAITYAKASDPAHGSVTVNADGSYTYKPNANFTGADSFTYSVSDGKGSNTYTISVTVAPVNHAPAAGNATISTPEEQAISGHLPAATDRDGDSVTYAKAANPAHGAVVVNADGSYSYTPAANYFGADSFSYSVSDGKGGSSIYTVSINVTAVNHAPVGLNSSATTAEDTPLSGSLPRATDRDGDALSYALGTGAAHGTVTVAADGKFTYTPARDYNGSDSFTYVVSDGHGGTATYTVSLDVTPVNDAPVGHGGADGTGTVGDPLQPVTVPAFTDVDSPAITYSATLANGGPLPAWLSFDPATRTFSGTPPAGSAGTLAIKVTGSDGQLSDSVAVTITVRNPPAPSQSVSIASMSKDTGASATDFITNDGSAGRIVSGSLSAALGKNEVVQVSFDGGASWTTASTSGTSWIATDGGAHGGNWTIMARVANTVSSLNGGTASRDVVLDTTPPAAPTVDSQTTSSTTPTLTGTAQVAPGEILRISVNGGTYEVIAVNGSWSLNLANSGAPLVPGQSYDVTATITDVAGNTRAANGTVAVSVPVVQQPKPDPAPQPTPAPVPVQPAPAPTPPTGGETPTTPVSPSNPAGPTSPAAPSSSVDTPAAPGSQVGGDAVRIVGGQGTRSADSSLELQITRSAELSDVYTRSEGFRTVVAPAQEPALVLFQGVPDQYVESGTHLSLSVPADAFAHTQPKAIVRLAAQLQDGRPLPSWISFNGQTGQFTGDAPAGQRGELRIKVIARDMDGREAVALFRVNVGQGRVAGEIKVPAGKPGLSQQLRAAAQRPAVVRAPQP